MKVLIAEDDPILQRVLQANLIEWGYEVIDASDGNEAWEIIQQPKSPSLVLSDWMMPGMDGLTLCRNIRRMDRPDYIYFIVLTAKNDVIEALEAGADGYMAKTLDMDPLIRRIGDLLGVDQNRVD
ncbi:MAG: response regulator [Deltaproteobacteria bacterium]|nr:response regulator [Deltaproteobacteria bacterium]